MIDNIQKNKELIEIYPFLLPRNRWTDEVDKEYDYSYTELDLGMEEGWIRCFGIPLLKDLKEILVKNNCFNSYRITEIKEKWGQLRWYDNGAPEEWQDHLYAWEYISEHTCKNCGKFPVPMRYDGWISPYCDECFQELSLAVKSGKKTLEEVTCKYPYGDRLLEYVTISCYKDGKSIDKYIDLKPFYDKIGYKYDNLVTLEELEKYNEYKKVLNKWESINGKIKDLQIIPLEIQQLNPFI